MTASTQFCAPLAAFSRLARLSFAMLVCVCSVTIAAPKQLIMSEVELQHFLAAAQPVSEWKSAWVTKLGKPRPSDHHLLKVLVENGADDDALGKILQAAGISKLDDFIALEQRASDIYVMLYSDPSGLASMAVAIELTVKGQTVTPQVRARMIKNERLAIEHERRAKVSPETIELVSKHALELARALGDIR